MASKDYNNSNRFRGEPRLEYTKGEKLWNFSQNVYSRVKETVFDYIPDTEAKNEALTEEDQILLENPTDD